MANAIHEIIPSETQIPEPGADAEKLNDYIIKYNPYRAWAMWPGKGKLYKAVEPHGALLTTFVNNTAYYSIKKKKGMPDASIIAKENYSAEKKFTALTVMYKVKGYNPEAGDWFWAKYRPDGTAEASGKVKMCIDCHSKAKDNDFIMTSKVK
ncbi:MAG: cytochrome P460 family protein [Nitrospirae bacterium]|nr:cytochrome P460 family protein [Nitrospirota bacterium]